MNTNTVSGIELDDVALDGVAGGNWAVEVGKEVLKHIGIEAGLHLAGKGLKAVGEWAGDKAKQALDAATALAEAKARGVAGPY